MDDDEFEYEEEYYDDTTVDYTKKRIKKIIIWCILIIILFIIIYFIFINKNSKNDVSEVKPSSTDIVLSPTPTIIITPTLELTPLPTLSPAPVVTPLPTLTSTPVVTPALTINPITPVPATSVPTVQPTPVITATQKPVTPKPAYIITMDSRYELYKNIAAYNSNTLKYRIFNYQEQQIVLVWVANPLKQLNTALAKINAKGLGSAADILSNEIKNYGYQNKGLVAVNASFIVNGSPDTGVVLSHGNVAKNDGISGANLGLSGSGSLKIYLHKTVEEIQAAGVRNTFVISGPALIDNSSVIAKRTQICQYDENNFVILSGKGTVKGVAEKIKNLTNCSNPYNLDGGGSRKLYYKTSVNSYMEINDDKSRFISDMLYFVEQ